MSVYPFLFIFHLIRWYLEVKGGEEKKYCCFLLISIAMFPFFFSLSNQVFNHLPLIVCCGKQEIKGRKNKENKTKLIDLSKNKRWGVGFEYST